MKPGQKISGKNAASSGHKLINIDKVDVLISLWDMADVVANSLGVIAGLAFYFTPLRRILRAVDSLLRPRF